MLKKISQVLATILLVSSVLPLLASAHDIDIAGKLASNVQGNTQSNSSNLSATANAAVSANVSHDKDKNDSDSDKAVSVSTNSQVKVTDTDNDNDNDQDDNAIKILGNGSVVPMFFVNGTVTAVSSTGFTMTTALKPMPMVLGSSLSPSMLNAVATVNTASALLIRLPNTVIALSAIQVGDQVWVQGQNSNGQINATVVYDLPVTIKPARAKGTVTAVNGNTLSVQAKNGQNITVNTDSNTTVTQNGNAASVANITVGSKISFSGLWDSVLNVFNAIRIRIRSL
jgi:hypothetical protein